MRIKANHLPNTIYDDTIVKYTINLPIDLYGRITGKSKRTHVGRSVLIRAILEDAFVDERPLSMKQLIEREHRAQEIVYIDPPKRYTGFVGGLMRNSFVYSWFRRRRNQRQMSLQNFS
jgi:hypothetical protein